MSGLEEAKLESRFTQVPFSKERILYWKGKELNKIALPVILCLCFQFRVEHFKYFLVNRIVSVIFLFILCDYDY